VTLSTFKVVLFRIIQNRLSQTERLFFILNFRFSESSKPCILLDMGRRVRMIVPLLKTVLKYSAGK